MEENKKNHDCKCGKGENCCGKHNHDEEVEVEEFEEVDEEVLEELDTVVLTLEDNSEIECGILGVFEVDGRDGSYIALVDDENEIILYRYEELGEEEADLQVIEDDQEYEEVKDTFEKLFVDEE